MTTIIQPDVIKTQITQPNNVLSILNPPAVIKTTLTIGQGPAGASGTTGSFYQHDQPSALDTWIVNHNLNIRPNVQVFSVGGVQMFAEVIHIDANQVRVYFDNPVAGYAVCS